jgi:hypothetical protein
MPLITCSDILLADGLIWTWGSNNYGELGRKKGNFPQSLQIKNVRAFSLDCGGDSTGIVSGMLPKDQQKLQNVTMLQVLQKDRRTKLVRFTIIGILIVS